MHRSLLFPLLFFLILSLLALPAFASEGAADEETPAARPAVSRPVITAQPKSVTASSGAQIVLSVKATGSSLKYQWQYKAASASSWKTWSGKTSSSVIVTASAKNNGCLYRVVVKNTAGSVTSSSARLTVTGVKPAVTAQPQSVTVVSGKTVAFKVSASGTGVSYQWQYSSDSGKTWKNWSGKTSSSVSVTATSKNNGVRYRCRVKNSVGSVYSAAAKLTVVKKPTVTSNPASVTAAKGSAAAFRVKATGGALSYQWQYSADGGKTWKNWSGKTSSSVSVTATANNNGVRYRCRVKNAAGTAYSAAAKLTVVSPPVITSHPSSVSAAKGSTVTFRVKATGSSLKYQWQYSTDGGKTYKNWAEKTSPTLSVYAGSNNGVRYRCLVYNSVSSVLSSPAKLTVR